MDFYYYVINVDVKVSGGRGSGLIIRETFTFRDQDEAAKFIQKADDNGFEIHSTSTVKFDTPDVAMETLWKVKKNL